MPFARASVDDWTKKWPSMGQGRWLSQCSEPEVHARSTQEEGSSRS